jgi:hypothetical protein
MKSFHVIYLPTGRKEKNRDGTEKVLTGNTERGAKSKYTRDGGYYDWTLYVLREVV